MVVNWRDETPIQKNEQLILTEFSFNSYMLEAKCLGQYVTGNFSCVEGYIVLERKIGYYVMFVLIPSLLCVMAR